jgi:hypothetical protein
MACTKAISALSRFSFFGLAIGAIHLKPPATKKGSEKPVKLSKKKAVQEESANPGDFEDFYSLQAGMAKELGFSIYLSPGPVAPSFPQRIVFH